MKIVTQHTAVTVSDTIIRFTSILMKHSQKSWVILLMNIHTPNRVIYDVSK